MIQLFQYNYIKQVKDSSPFTCNLTLNQYIKGVKYRMSEWYGMEESMITDKDVYNVLKATRKKN